MSSMTEEECDEWAQIESDEWEANSIDWLNAHHFDYRGLIPKGLALKASEGMYTDDKFVPITKEELEKTRISSKDYLI